MQYPGFGGARALLVSSNVVLFCDRRSHMDHTNRAPARRSGARGSARDGQDGGVIIVRATKNLRQRIGPPTLVEGERSTTVLGDWYASSLPWRPQVALLVNEVTLLPVLMPLAPGRRTGWTRARSRSDSACHSRGSPGSRGRAGSGGDRHSPRLCGGARWRGRDRGQVRRRTHHGRMSVAWLDYCEHAAEA